MKTKGENTIFVVNDIKLYATDINKFMFFGKINLLCVGYL